MRRTLTSYVAAGDYARIRAAAERAGLSDSAFVARAALARTNPPSVAETVAGVLGEMYGGASIAERSPAGLRAVLQRATDTTADVAVFPVDLDPVLLKARDAGRYAVASSNGFAGPSPMPSTFGTTFRRGRVTQSTTAGTQTEGAALASQKMTIAADDIDKEAVGGFVTLTEQDSDWSPSFLEGILQDLAESYAIQSETITTAAIVAAAPTTGTLPASNTAALWLAALVSARTTARGTAKVNPDVLYVAADMDDTLRGLSDTNGEPVLGDLLGQLGLRLVYSPAFASGTCIVGCSRFVRSWELDKGRVQIENPATMSVDVAYRGYFAADANALGLCALV